MQGSEFAEALAKADTVTPEYEEQIRKWYFEKLPKRVVLKKRIVEEEPPLKKGASKRFATKKL